MYVNTLNDVLTTPEISSAVRELDLSTGVLRNSMIGRARRVFESAQEEFSTYLEAVAYENAIAADHSNISHGAQTQMTKIIRTSWIALAGVGAILIVIGFAAYRWRWPWLQPLVWPGGITILIAAALAASDLAFKNRLFADLVREVFSSTGGPELVAARDRLMASVSQTELLAQTRTLVNNARQRRFGHQYAVVSSPGLSEVYDSSNRVPTSVAAELDGLINRLDGASIGVAGPRGSGKSMLIRRYCEDVPFYYFGEFDWTTLMSANPGKHGQGDLRCLVSAPVDYDARDFVLHLFATFCRAVLKAYDERTRDIPNAAWPLYWVGQSADFFVSLAWRLIFYGGAVAALLWWQHDIVRAIPVPLLWVRAVAVLIGLAGGYETARSLYYPISYWTGQVRKGREDALAVAARRNLSRVRFLQTYTSGWSGGLRLTGGRAEGTYSRSVARAEQPLSYPEIVDDFRRYARDVAEEVHRRGDRVFVGVDELDKIGSSEQAERFLNEIKGIFGIPHLYFMVSVSDDALTAFERRGLPLRDAFDSSFDEIIHVSPLTYTESRRLLYRRVIGLTEPYVALCHCLAGGLARDLVRAARQVVRTAATLRSPEVRPSGPLSIPEGDFIYSSDYTPPVSAPEDRPLSLGVVSAAVVRDEIRRKLRAVRQQVSRDTDIHTVELQDIFYEMNLNLSSDEPILGIVDLIAERDTTAPAAVTSLRFEIACYAYYCATLQEVFTDSLDYDRIVQATEGPPGPGSFDSLAAARNAFALNTSLAWRLITRFRAAWSLETREPVASGLDGS